MNENRRIPYELVEYASAQFVEIIEWEKSERIIRLIHHFILGVLLGVLLSLLLFG